MRTRLHNVYSPTALDQNDNSRLTSNKENWRFVIVQFHLARNPTTIKVSVPQAFHASVRRSMLIGWFTEWDAEVALLSLHRLANRWL